MEKKSEMFEILVKQNEELKGLINELIEEQREQKKELDKLSYDLARVSRVTIAGTHYSKENMWAEVFNNTIVNSEWLLNKTFSPGRWAVGYPYLYAMYRVLNEIRPKKILELGLGQSTRMIAQYAEKHKGVKHHIVEHDAEWIDFFKNDFTLSKNSEIVCLEREMVSYKEASEVRVFKGFSEAFRGKNFDFISIDAPWGGDMKVYSRIDVLGILPDCLSEDFVIMIHDAERIGETNMILEMENILKQNGIEYVCGKYSGTGDTVLITTKKLSFLCSM